MPRIITPFGNFEVSAPIQCQLDRAVRAGERSSIVVEVDGVSTHLTGHVRRHELCHSDYIVDFSPDE